jgi:hypothetical protein
LPARPAALAGLLWLALAATARAADDTSIEFWPEINAYVGLDERTRVMLSAAATRAMEGQANQALLSVQNAQLSVNLDYTLAPILRRDVPQTEWSKNRLVWTRLGFEYGTSGSPGNDSFRSYTGIVELNSRLPLQEGVWLTNRLRADFRNINGTPSQRYRVRLGAAWDQLAFEHPIAPYANVEALYDTRYEKWSRLTLKTGLETPIGGNWRVEPYLALQLNRPQQELSRVLGLGLTFKVYFD